MWEVESVRDGLSKSVGGFPLWQVFVSIMFAGQADSPTWRHLQVLNDDCGRGKANTSGDVRT